MIEGLRNIIHREVQRVLDRRIRRMPGIVDAYNPSQHAVKLKLQPSGTLTGWVQIETDQVGLLIAPSIGDPGWLEFHESDRRAAVFVGSNHNDSFPPPQEIAAGDWFYQNKSGSKLYFKADGSVTATDKDGSTIVLDGAGSIALTPTAGTVTVNGNLVVTESFNVQNTQGVPHPCNVTGNINLTGAIDATGDVVGAGHSLAGHIHLAPGGDTGPPIG